MFEAYNDFGKLQFNATTYAYHFVGKGSFSVTDSPAYSPPESHATTAINVTLPYVADIIFFQSNNARISGRGQVVPVNGQTQFEMYAGPLRDDIPNWPGSGYGDGTATQNYAQVDYWAFRSMKRLAPSTSMDGGMEIYDAAGQVCYSTKYKPLKIVGGNSIPALQLGQSSAQLPSAPAGKVYAYCVTGTADQAIPDIIQQGNYIGGGVTPFLRFNQMHGEVDYYASSVQPGFSNMVVLTADVTGL